VREVRTIAVIGAGAAGRHIARLTALGGYRTILEDVLPATLRKAEVDLMAQLDQAVARGELAREAADAAFARVEYASSVEAAARQADLVIEAVPDERDSKMEIFALLDRMCRPDTVLVSSTAALRVTDVTDVTHRAGHCVGLRFGQTGRPLEVVRGRATEDGTFEVACAVSRKLARETVTIQE
jgi:3-hydroxybutyryl-CoA dehydrogenase